MWAGTCRLQKRHPLESLGILKEQASPHPGLLYCAILRLEKRPNGGGFPHATTDYVENGTSACDKDGKR